MKNWALFIIISGLSFPFISQGQSTYLPEGSKDYQTNERLEIKEQKNSNLLFSTVKPYSRKLLVENANYLDSLVQKNGGVRSLTDRYNLTSLQNNNEEWSANNSQPKSFNTLYKSRQNLIEVNNKDIFLTADPILRFQAGIETPGSHNVSLATYGITSRGLIAKKIGFSFSLSANNEKGPQFYTSRVLQYNAVPGFGKYNNGNNNSFNYIDARGYVTFGFVKHIDVQIGYDKNFIGNGYRSMFLSDFASSYPFLKINTRIWKLNYENIFAQLEPLNFGGIPKTNQHKYMVMHHLSINLAKSVNLGLFESIILARDNHFDFEYLNPIIFLRQAEGNVGSPDKAHVGIDLKANVAKKFQFYSQFLLDEFLLHQFVHHTGFWANKWAFQAGAKYIDAFKIPNLDLQLETNIVRPFTFSHYDPITNYSTFNQPLADPIGSNFHEVIGIVKYQPLPKWRFSARLIYYDQGLDSAGLNTGSNIFLDYRTRPRDYGFKIAGGNKATCANATINAGYEIFDNLFVEASALFRKYTVANGVGNNSTSMFSLGVRWNIAQREYNY